MFTMNNSCEIFRLHISNWQRLCLILLYLCFVQCTSTVLGLIKHLLIWLDNKELILEGQLSRVLLNVLNCFKISFPSISANILLNTPEHLYKRQPRRCCPIHVL